MASLGCGSSSSPQRLANVLPAASATDSYTNIDDTNSWSQCLNGCADTGGTGPQPQTNQALVNSPSEDGVAHWFSVGGIYPYANSYWYVERTTTTNPAMPPALVTQQSYSFDLWIPSGEDNNPQAIEWETHQQFQGWIYNTGWQALYAGSGDPTKMMMRTFQWNPTGSGPAKGWYATGILIPRFSPDAWHHVQTDEHVSGTTIFFDDIIVDGKKYVPSNSSGSTHQAIQGGPKYGDKFNNAIQLDLDNVPMPFDIYIDNMRIVYSTQ